VVEACQGLITAQFCEGRKRDIDFCSFHQAMLELHETTVGTLSKWTLMDLIGCPANPDGEAHGCRMVFVGCEKYFESELSPSHQRVRNITMKDSESGGRF
jgi:hypothetical protein